MQRKQSSAQVSWQAPVRPQAGRHEWLLRGGLTSRAELAGSVSKTRIVSVADLKSERGSTKRRTTDKVMDKVEARWLQFENEGGGNGKSAAAVTIAHELSRAYSTVYNYLTYETLLYPDVVDAARRALGLPAK